MSLTIGALLFQQFKPPSWLFWKAAWLDERAYLMLERRLAERVSIWFYDTSSYSLLGLSHQDNPERPDASVPSDRTAHEASAAGAGECLRGVAQFLISEGTVTAWTEPDWAAISMKSAGMS